jgi:6-phosphogluconolactonase
MEPKISIFKNTEILIETLTANFLEVAREGNNIYIALAGGNTPKLFYQHLAKKAKKNQSLWNHVHLFWGDERCVPPTHPESNFGMVKLALLDHLLIPDTNVHRIIGEDNPEKEVDRYTKEIKTFLPNSIDNKPQFDWILLGIGEDGHTASIFPDSEKALATNTFTTQTTHPVTGQRRITLTLPIINQARRVTFIVTGIKKANIASSILTKSSKYLDLPAAMVSPSNGLLEWYMDIEAAAKLASV